MRQVSTTLGALCAAALALGATSVPRPAMAGDPPPATQASRVVSMTATVDQIDKGARLVTLKDPAGHLHEVLVGRNVNLDQTKVGDVVDATYYDEVALEVHRAGTSTPRSVEKTSQHEGVTTRQASVTADVVAVDPDAHTLTIRGQQQHIHVLRVEDPTLLAHLNKLKAGDYIEVTYTQALATSLDPASP